MKRCFKEYCESSGIHGLKYFSENRSVFEKIWWLVLFFLATGTCTVFIAKIFIKWQSNNAIVISFSSEQTHIDDIPFPAITICSESKIDSAKFNLLQNHDILASLGFLCRNINYTERGFDDFTNLKRTPTNYDRSCDDIKTVSPDFYPVACRIGNDDVNWFENCSHFFSSRFTDEGYCHTFNALNRRDYFREHIVQGSRDGSDLDVPQNDWDVENSRYGSGAYDTFPFRARPGMEYPLQFIIPTYKMSQSDCRGFVRGYRILLHAPFRFPNPSLQYIRIGEEKDVAISVKPSLIAGFEGLKNYQAEKRSCYFAREKKLRFFKIYSQYNCEMECLTNYTLKAYDCVHFYMPRESTTKVCHSQEGVGLKGNVINTSNFTAYYRLMSQRAKTMEYMTSYCNCLPLCTDITYDYSVSQLDWNPVEQVKLLKNKTKATRKTPVNKVKFTRITVFFNDRYLIGKERRPMYEHLEFLSEIGGVMGLFMGFSVLSVVEILYFLTIRLLCNWRLYGRWTTPKEIQQRGTRSFRGS